MTACGPGSAMPLRQHADEVSSSQTAPSSAAGWVATTLCKTVTRLAIERASCQAFGRWRSTQTDGLCVALEHPSCVRGCDPTVPTPNVDDESLPAVIVISCTLAGRRSRVAGACAFMLWPVAGTIQGYQQSHWFRIVHLIQT